MSRRHLRVTGREGGRRFFARDFALVTDRNSELREARIVSYSSADRAWASLAHEITIMLHRQSPSLPTCHPHAFSASWSWKRGWMVVIALDCTGRLHPLASFICGEDDRGVLPRCSPKYAINMLAGIRRWLACGLSSAALGSLAHVLCIPSRPWKDFCSDENSCWDAPRGDLCQCWRSSICGGLRVASGLGHSANRSGEGT